MYQLVSMRKAATYSIMHFSCAHCCEPLQSHGSTIFATLSSSRHIRQTAGDSFEKIEPRLAPPFAGSASAGFSVVFVFPGLLSRTIMVGGAASTGTTHS